MKIWRRLERKNERHIGKTLSCVVSDMSDTNITSPLWAYIIVSLGIGVLGGLFTQQGLNSSWYQSMSKAPIQPPSWFFFAIWTVIYIILGYAAYIGYKKTGNQIFNVLFAANLFFNVAWCYAFFVARKPQLALLLILLLFITVVWLIVLLWNVDRIAAVLLFVYAGWLMVAGYLNWYYTAQMIQ